MKAQVKIKSLSRGESGDSIKFKKATGHEPADFVKKVGEELEKHFGPGEMVDGTLTFNAKAKGKKKDAA